MDHFPPIPFVKQVAMHCPESLFTYILLWEFADPKTGILVVSKKDVKMQFLVTKSIFERQLMYLVREGLLNIPQNTDDKYYFELVLWGDIVDE